MPQIGIDKLRVNHATAGGIMKCPSRHKNKWCLGEVSIPTRYKMKIYFRYPFGYYCPDCGALGESWGDRIRWTFPKYFKEK